MDKLLNKQCGYTDVELECRFDKLRTEETNIANFVADIFRTEFYDCDFAYVNSGSLRSNAIIPAGPLTLRFCADLHPMIDHVVVLKMKGKTVHEMLENSVSAYPQHDGRFPCISGIHMAFDPSKPAHSRIKPEDLTLPTGEPIDMDKEYKVCMRGYTSLGKEGFDMLTNPENCVEKIVDEEHAPQC
jgi:5'-nucleotidase